MDFPKKHLFICTNAPGVENKCHFKGGEKLHAKVKQLARDLPDAQEIRVNKSGCLHKCEHGIAAVLYPKGEWKLNLIENDEQALLDLLKD